MSSQRPRPRFRTSDLPEVGGTWIVEGPRLQACSVDAGNIIHRAPSAVLQPQSSADIATAAEFCGKEGIDIAARGQGHTTYGQSMVDGGIVVDMNSMSQVVSVEPDVIETQGGCCWSTIVRTCVPRGSTPPVLTGYLGLSVGGTLAVGGVSSTNASGTQVDRVLSLEVVTGNGDVVICSAERDPDLFESVLAGLGQFGIVTSARLELVDAPRMARVFQLAYSDQDAFFHDLRILLEREEFSDVYDAAEINPNGVVHGLVATYFFGPEEPPSNQALMRDLSRAPGEFVSQDLPFIDYALRVDRLVEEQVAAGGWNGVQHPWLDVWLSDDRIEEYTAETCRNLTPEDIGSFGFFLIFPQRVDRLTRPMLRIPRDATWVYLFDLLTAAERPGPNDEFATRMAKRNRVLFDRARQLGGTRYPIGTLDFSSSDWQAHYGEAWELVERRKKQFDPHGILTPGPGIFRR